MKSLQTDFEATKRKWPSEPETRVKHSSIRALESKFTEVLRDNLQVQSEFKSILQNKIKRQMKQADQNLSDEKLEQLARDPDAAQTFLQE